MPHDTMRSCERKALFLVGNEKVWRWVVAEVAALPSEKPPFVRCVHCHGRVRVHKQNGEQGSEDHVEHLSRQDSEYCRGGHHFKGEHRLSLRPVT